MANSCNNVIKISYLEDKVDKEVSTKMLEDFKNLFAYDDDFVVYYEADDNDIFEIQMTTRWAAPNQELLQDFAIKHNCIIIGVSWEFGNNYVYSFELLP